MNPSAGSLPEFGSLNPGLVERPDASEGVLVLREGQWTPNPTSTKHMLYGPMRIEFHEYPSHVHYTVLAD